MILFHLDYQSLNMYKSINQVQCKRDKKNLDNTHTPFPDVINDEKLCNHFSLIINFVNGIGEKEKSGMGRKKIFCLTAAVVLKRV